MADQAGRVAFVFPGQGSQKVGMGREIWEKSEAARAIFERAESLLPFSVKRLCFEGPEQELSQTKHAQPAILTVSVAYWAALREQQQNRSVRLTPDYVAGHSFGQYAAMVAAESIDFEQAVELVKQRGRFMEDCGRRRPGGMAAVIGLGADAVRHLCERASHIGIVNLATQNSEDQTVISGEDSALERVIDLAKEAGARRVIPLDISIPSHSPLMEEAARRLRKWLDHVSLQTPSFPVISNITTQAMNRVDELKRELVEQTCQPVLWAQSVERMRNQGVSTFVEVGPGRVLSRVIRRSHRLVETVSVRDILQNKWNPPDDGS